MDSGKSGMNPVAKTIIISQKEYWPLNRAAKAQQLSHEFKTQHVKNKMNLNLILFENESYSGTLLLNAVFGPTIYLG